jgi:hypothetical protein
MRMAGNSPDEKTAGPGGLEPAVMHGPISARRRGSFVQRLDRQYLAAWTNARFVAYAGSFNRIGKYSWNACGEVFFMTYDRRLFGT